MPKARLRPTRNSTLASVPSVALASATEIVGRQSTLWLGSWASPSWASSASVPFAADRIEPPLASSVSATTAMPCGE